METCRFVSSWGGVARCGEEAYELGFCRFHFDCYRRREIDDRGIISESISDQVRRREINFHGLSRGSGRVG